VSSAAREAAVAAALGFGTEANSILITSVPSTSMPDTTMKMRMKLDETKHVKILEKPAMSRMSLCFPAPGFLFGTSQVEDGIGI
jgi:hypothetical protein